MKKETPVTVKITRKQMRVIANALEAYERASMGQFKNALEIYFPHLNLSWDNFCSLERIIKDFINRENPDYFPTGNGFHGIFSKKIPSETRTAYQIEKAFLEYLSVEGNDGYWDSLRNYDGPFSGIDEEAPTIVGFKKYKDFPIDKEEIDLVRKGMDEKNFNGIWGVLRRKSFLKELHYEKAEIVRCEPPIGETVYGGRNDWYAIRVYRPVKKKQLDF